MTDRLFWFWFAVVALLRLILAANVPLFGDEAFYWQESQRLAPGYSDLPPATAWAIAASTSLFGHDLLALRLPFVLAGLATVLLIRYVLRNMAEPAVANRGALVALLVPIGHAVGVLAIPDVLLTWFLVLGAWGLVQARSHQHWRWWILFGLALACAWAVHWRTAMMCVAGAVLLVFDRSSRALWTTPRFWWGLGLSLLGLLPSLWFNAEMDWPAVRFQAMDRHDWGFHAGGLWMPLEQAIAWSPWVLGLALFAAVHRIRSMPDAQARSPGSGLWCWLGLGLFGAYFVIGCFADQERTRIHWPLPAFFLMLPAMLPWLQRPVAGRSGLTHWPVLAGTAAAGSLVVLAGLAVLWLKPAWTEPFGKRFGANFIGYESLAERLRPRLEANPETVLVADNFLLAAQLDWYLRQSPFVLDAPRNAEHGRAVQLELWSRDEASLKQAPVRDLILAVDDSALFAADRFGFYVSLCDRLGGLRFDGEHIDVDGRRRFTMWTRQRGETRCDQPILSMLFPIEYRARDIVVAGFAVQHRGRVRTVTLEGDGMVVKTFTMNPQGPIVDTHWPELSDGNGAHVGFRFELDRSELPREPSPFRLIAEADDGQRREVGRVMLGAQDPSD